MLHLFNERTDVNPLPKEIQPLLAETSTQLQRIFGSNLVGIYVYGSVAMGGYNIQSSDIDLLVVVNETMSVAMKIAVGQAMVALSAKAPPGGFEVTVIRQDTLNDITYPTAHEFYFSTDKQAVLLAGTLDIDTEVVAHGLAVNILLTKERGICLYGQPIEQVFPTIPSAYVIEAIVFDFEWSYANVMKGPDDGECRVPNYAVLNACRLLAYYRLGRLTSKIEGAQWGMEHLPTEFRPIIKAALQEYGKRDERNTVDAKLLKQFLVYVRNGI